MNFDILLLVFLYFCINPHSTYRLTPGATTNAESGAAPSLRYKIMAIIQ